MHIQHIRLWPRRPPDGAPPLGLCCDAEGLSLGPNSPLIRRSSDRDGRARYRARSLFETNAILSVGYGREIDAFPIYRKLERIAEWMTAGEWTKASLAALHLRLPALPDRAALTRLQEAEAILKVWVPDLHPRWPAHSDEGHGGWFRPRDGSGSLLVPVQAPVRIFTEIIRRLLPRLLRKPPVPRPPRRPAGRSAPSPPKPTAPEEAESPGIGHNNPPEEIESEAHVPNPLVPPLPAERPDRTYPWGRSVADALAATFAMGNMAAVHAIARMVDAAGWLADQYANIESYFDPPKTYEELSANARIKGPHPGYEDHHIVEQGRQNDFLDQDQIQSPENIVRIPYYRHKDVQSYYQTTLEELGGLTPREYLKGKSFEEQFDFGLKALRKLGIVK